MNFAFVTIVLLVISLPGVAARRSYYASRFSLNYISTNLLNELIWSIVPAILLHSLAILLLEKFTDYTFLLEHLGYLIANGNDKDEIHLVFSNIHRNIGNILFYIAGLTFVSIILGNAMRLVVRWASLDIMFRILRFPNRWHYLFTGEYLDIEKGWRKGWKYHKNIDFIMVDVLMQLGGETIIYSGILEDYFLSKTSGGLDRIIIKYPSKKNFNTNGEGQYRDIPGNYLSIPYDKILNINIQYYELDNKGKQAKQEETKIETEKQELVETK